MKKVIIFLVSWFCLITLNSCETPKGVPQRDDLASSPNLWKRSYLKPSRENAPNYSCSFIEIDGNGDFLLPSQYENALSALKQKSSKPTLLISYCHGWRNDSQSEDVLRFCEFLHKFAITAPVSDKYNIAGIYFSWRGAKFSAPGRWSHLTDKYYDVTNDFDFSPLIDPARLTLRSSFNPILEFPSYWSRKRVAEAESSGVALPFAIYSLTKLVKEGHASSKSVAIGHSFGALMMEKCLLPASISQISQKSELDDLHSGIGGLDLVLLFNSAAPSVFAKQFRDVVDLRYGSSGAPLIISVTSVDDKATAKAHPIANSFAGFQERNASKYIIKREKSEFEVPSGYFFKRTPGHNPFLTTHEIERNKFKIDGEGPYNGDDVVDFNLRKATPDLFYTSNPEASNPSLAWSLSRRASDESFYKIGNTAIPLSQSRYWMVRCKNPLINDHGDVWSYRMVELTCALYKISQMK